MEMHTVPCELAIDLGPVGLFTVCPRCGKEARMFVENDLTVYEHRPSNGDETREVCIVA
jgi:hypothetical protein